jgi:hypothetical protein
MWRWSIEHALCPFINSHKVFFNSRTVLSPRGPFRKQGSATTAKQSHAHDLPLSGKRESALLGAALLELFDSLLLILDLYRSAVVETLEFPREARQRLVRLLHLSIELLHQRLGRR